MSRRPRPEVKPPCGPAGAFHTSGPARRGRRGPAEHRSGGAFRERRGSWRRRVPGARASRERGRPGNADVPPASNRGCLAVRVRVRHKRSQDATLRQQGGRPRSQRRLSAVIPAKAGIQGRPRSEGACRSQERPGYRKLHGRTFMRAGHKRSQDADRPESTGSEPERPSFPQRGIALAAPVPGLRFAAAAAMLAGLPARAPGRPRSRGSRRDRRGGLVRPRGTGGRGWGAGRRRTA